MKNQVRSGSYKGLNRTLGSHLDEDNWWVLKEISGVYLCYLDYNSPS